MSVRERRNRKDRRAKTTAQLWAWRCGICTAKISQADVRNRRNVAVLPPGARTHGQRFQLAHLYCPGERTPW